MTSYYFVATSLPALTLGEPAEITFDEFMTLVKANLNEHDRRQVRVVQRLVDIDNLSALWRGIPLDPRGSMNKVELEDAIGLGIGFPAYVLQFLTRHESNDERLRAHSELRALFFQQEAATATGFLRALLQFEREWRLVMVGLRAKQLKRDVVHELQYEPPDDTIVAQIMAQRDAASFEPPDGYEGLRPILLEHSDNPRLLYQELARYRYERIDELQEGAMFSIDFILGYMTQLMIVEKWQEINERGNRVA